MRFLLRILSYLFITVIICTKLYAQVSPKEIVIGVVSDGYSAENTMFSAIKQEFSALIKGKNITVRYLVKPEFNAQLDPKKVPEVLHNAMNNPEVDIILADGSLITQFAAKPDVQLTKPFVSMFIQRADILKLPFSEKDHSLKNNLSFMVIPSRTERDIRTFEELLKFDTLHVLVEPLDMYLLEFDKQGLNRYEEKLGVKIKFIEIAVDDNAPLLDTNDDIQAVYFTRLPHLSADRRAKLIELINERKIPSFSALGHTDVKRGVLAGITPDLTQQVARRISLNLLKLINDDDSRDLPILLSVDSRLMINARTAALVDYTPSFETVVVSQIIQQDALDSDALPLSFSEALQQAERSNVSLSIKDADVEDALQTKNVARSDLFPQVGMYTSYTKLDADTARAFEPSVVEHQTMLGISMSQLIYDDEVWSDFKSFVKLFEGTQYDRESTRLDVLNDAGQAFYRFSLARVLMKIEADNLSLTQDNLEIAKLRQEVGYSGRDEVFRWEAELASRQSSLFEANATVETQRIILNQIMGMNQDIEWIPEEVEFDPNVFCFLDGNLNTVINDMKEFKKFSSFSVEEALTNSPQIKFIAKNLEAQKIQLAQRKRKFYIPRLTANYNYNWELDRSGSGIPHANDEFFDFTVAATYPLFEGGGRYFEVKKASAELRSLEEELRLANQLVERRVRTALQRMENSFPRIRFSANAAECAHKNLLIVQDKYSQGTVNITDLLEAQNQNFTEQQNVAIATYSFLIDLLEFQRSISWFEDGKTSEEKEKLFIRIKEYLTL